MRHQIGKVLLCLIVVSAFFLSGESHAVPAAPGETTLTQADGTKFSARQWGDEWSHGWETTDGYSVVFNKITKNWEYARNDSDGRLVSSSRAVKKDPLPAGVRTRVRPTGSARQAILQRKGLQPKRVVPQTGGANVPVILINFSNTPTTYNGSNFNTLLFGTGNNSMKDYYEEVSYGVFTVSAGPGGVVNWRVASNTHDYYGTNDGFGYDMWPGTLVREAVAGADGTFNFAPYDQDGDCYVDAVNIVHQGSGEEVVGSPSTDIWSHSWDLNSAYASSYSDGGEYTTNDACPSGGNIKVNEYVIQPETLSGGLHTMGVFAHEYGHALGLPDLYDTDYSSEGAGWWSLMASGSWNKVTTLGDRPAHMDAWSKYALGWITPTEVSGTLTGESISSASSSADVYKLLNGKPESGEYFLVENRQKTGFDAGLPGAGLLIWHIDGNYIICNSVLNMVNDSECTSPPCPSDHYGVALMQADNLWHLENGTNRGDAGDTYKASGNSSFTNTSSPNSKLHSGAASTVSVTNISASGATMTADLSVTPPSVSALQDGGFEDGTPNSYWNECSINFGTPICDFLSCGSDGGSTATGSRTGTYWSWFGGAGAGVFEFGSVNQLISIPKRSCADLSFYLEIPATGTTGYMSAVMDGGKVFTATEADVPPYYPYTLVTADVSAYADGKPHDLRFDSITYGGTGSLNFFLDDISIGTTPETFDDVPDGHWAENFISAIKCNNITAGCNPPTFTNYCPSGKVTRAEMAVFIIKALYGDSFTYSSTPQFSDVPDTFWAFKYIQKMYERGITAGCNPPTFTNYCPNSNVTRAEMAVFIIKALYGDSFTYSSTPHFSDVPDTFWAFTKIQRMFESGITRGCTATTYCPNSNVTRAEMAVFLTQAFLK